MGMGEDVESQTQPDEAAAPEVEAPETAPEEAIDASPEEAEADANAKADAPEGEEAAEAKGEDAKEDVAQDDDKRRRAGGWQRKIERLEREREILIQQLNTHRPSTAAPQAAAQSAEKTPEEKAADYIDSLVAKRLEAAEQQRAQAARVDAFQRRTAEVRAQNPDFEDVIMSASDVRVSEAVQATLLTSEQGPAIMYQLAKSPAELARICALPPLEAAREIGRLEAKLTSVAPSPKTSKPAARPPAPPSSVNGTNASTRSLDELSIADYKRAMKQRR